jgi:MFS family permease
MWPGTFSVAAARFPLGGTAMFGILALFGDAGAAVGPWLAGAVANAVSSTQSNAGGAFAALGLSGLRAGLLIGTIFPLGLALTTLAYGMAEKRRERNTRIPDANP